MKYEEAFTDYEKMRYEAAWDGFKAGDYSKMYAFIFKKCGLETAEYFLSLKKKEKKLYCARFVYLYHWDKEKCEKAKKYLEKNTDGVIW